MKLRHRILTLLLCLVLLLPQASLAAKSKGSSGADIRVLLSRLNLTDEAWMTLEGRYLARCSDGKEVLLPAGAQITVLLRNGGLVLFYDGLSLSAGKELTLLRRRDGDVEAGIRRQEAANLPVKQRQEAEVRKARAQQAWAAALRQRNQKPKKKTLKRRR